MLGPQSQPLMQHPGAALRENASYNFTDRNLGALMGGITGRGTVITFQWEKVYVAQPLGAPALEELRLKRTTQIVGDPSSISMEYITEELAQRVYPREYAYFTQTGEMPSSGTSLTELPGITLSTVQKLQIAGVMSIEDLSTCPDHLVSQISREAISVKKLAIEWLGRKNSSGDLISVAEQKASMDAYVRSSEAQMKSLQASNQALMAEVAAMRSMMGNGVAMQGASEGSSIGNTNENAPNIMDMPSGMDEGSGVLNDDDIINEVE